MTSRRDFLLSSAAAGFGLALPTQFSLNSAPKRQLRIAHLTDIHVQPEGAAPKGMARALEAVHNLKDKPDLIITGGDQIMDALGADKERSEKQWREWQAAMKDATIPAQHIIGNHDVWGWKNPSLASESKYGKVWAQEVLQLEKPYYSFNKAGWHFIMLDSTFQNGLGYTAKLDEAQFEWLADDLAKTPIDTPIMISSHEPLFCACALLDGDNEKSGNWQVPGAWTHIDFRRIKDLFVKHKNIKLAISGHIHLVDRVDYLGISYFCNGAVSGGWWGGDYQEFGPGFAVIDLYDDGSFKNEYINYKWKD